MLRPRSLPVLAVLLALGSSAIACGGDGLGAPNSGARATTSGASDAPSSSATTTSSDDDAPAATPTAAPTAAPAAPDASAPAAKPATPAPDLSPSGVVTRAYQLALERAPDAGGLAFWVDALGTGTSKLGVLRALATSDEFASRHAAKTNAEYVAYLYTRFLHRAPAADEVTFWANAIGSGTSRSAVADAFLTSAEFASNANPDFAFFF